MANVTFWGRLDFVPEDLEEEDFEFVVFDAMGGSAKPGASI
jgi:hypothetical protein